MEMTIDEALRRGVEAHQAGRVQEADGYYTAILQSQPDHPDANHNLGLIAVGVNKIGEALPLLNCESLNLSVIANLGGGSMKRISVTC